MSSVPGQIGPYLIEADGQRLLVQGTELKANSR